MLIHGNVGSTSYLNGLAECLAASRRVLRYDLFGRGFSGCGGWAHTHHLFSGQLAELLFRLHVDTPIQLVGYSLGAQVAVHFAALWPEKVSKLVLLCPAVAVPPALPVLLQLAPVRHLFGHIVRLLLQDPAYFAADWRDLRSSDRRARSSALEKVCLPISPLTTVSHRSRVAAALRATQLARIYPIERERIAVRPTPATPGPTPTTPHERQLGDVTWPWLLLTQLQ